MITRLNNVAIELVSAVALLLSLCPFRVSLYIGVLTNIPQ
jgi:hypothetical protein